MKDDIGKKFLIKSSDSSYYMGELVGADAFHYYLKNAGWLQDVGIHSRVLRDGVPTEGTIFNPHPSNVITRVPRPGSMVVDWLHALWRDPIENGQVMAKYEED